MRIAQIAPLAEAVTLFASRDSETSARLIACVAPLALMLERVRAQAHEVML